ncbi:MAG: GNAT family N-acetyltransferase [Patescibacteria group bacterium]
MNLQKQIVYQGSTKTRLKITISYPYRGDANLMMNYINTLSKERTFVYFQGEQNTIGEERKYLNSILDGLKKETAVCLLAFDRQKLIGVSQIEMKDKAQSHVGAFGISIAKQYRNQGVGMLLMNLVFEEAKKHLPQLKICTLGVFANNRIAINMYKQFGFTKYGRLPKAVMYRGKPIDEIYFFKTLSE